MSTGIFPAHDELQISGGIAFCGVVARRFGGDRPVMSASELQEAEHFFHERIPLTAAMGVRVVGNDRAGFMLEAPVALNHNHLGTAFGGSINAVATLAGYGLLWLELRHDSAELMVAESSIRFLRPVHQTIRAICARPSQHELHVFKSNLHERGKARIALRAAVEENGACAAEFAGTFVAFRR